MTRRSERNFLAADLVAVNSLLRDLTDDDVMSRFSLESRKSEIEEELSGLEALPPLRQAEVSLFFAGKPVDANRGMAAEFSAKALAAYQDSVKKISAFQRFGSLGDRGIVPGKDQSTLYITDVVRGSFGFQLEEMEDQLPIEDSSLKEAVNESTKLLLAFSSSSEEEYSTGVQQVEQRVVDSISEFFRILKDEEATVRLVTEDVDKWIDRSSIERAIERTKSIKIEVDDDIPLEGMLSEVLPTSRRFDFTLPGNNIISGTIALSLVDLGLQALQASWLHKPATGYFQIRSVTRPGREPKLFYTLLRIEEPQSVLKLEVE